MHDNQLTILLAEDDDGHAHLVQRNLSRSGAQYPVIRAADGQQALDFLRCDGPHAGKTLPSHLLLVLDINMPRLNGMEVLRQVKSDPRTASIPVIMLTTTDDPREIVRCYELGCAAYISKPVDYQMFLVAVQRLGHFLQVINLPPIGGGDALAH